MSNFNWFSELDQIIGPALTHASNVYIGPKTTTRFSDIFKPKLDLHENTEQNLVTAILELPGIKKEDVKLDVRNNVLTVSAENKIPVQLEGEGFIIRERRYGKWSRSLTLPDGVKETDIGASMADGVLAITFPKSSPRQGPKKIIPIA